jgi:hypothetical protein
MMKIERLCQCFFPREEREVEYYGFKLMVPVATKYLVVSENKIILAFPEKPEFIGHWKCGRKPPVSIAVVEFSGDVEQTIRRV